MKLNWMLIVLACMFCFSQNASAKDDRAFISKIDTYLSNGVDQGFSGAILIAKGGEILFKKGYGYANKEEKRPYSPETIVTVGSVSKQFTGAAILKLIEAKKFSVEDTLSLFFKNLPADKQTITIHQLLTHSAGFVDVIGDGDFDQIPTETFFKTLFATKLLYKPGTRHRYSNATYSILARIVELTSGIDYETFVRNELFKPAGMMETGYLKPKWQDERLAVGYAGGVFEMGTLVDRFRNQGQVSWVLKGNGGIHSTLNDMYRWYVALRSHKILSPTFTKMYTEPYIAETEADDSHYAYGWAIFKTDRGTKMVTHNGSNGVYFHDFIWLPKEDVAIIYTTNGLTRDREGIAWRAERMMFDETYQPKPMGENPMRIVADFMAENKPSETGKLLAKIQKHHAETFKHPRYLNRMGYMMMELERDPEWIVAVFDLNTQLFPENDNVWDSLGDGYFAKGEKEKAMANFKKAAAMGNTYSVEKLKKMAAEK